MKIMEIPAYGPMFRFSDANVYYALYVLADGKRLGRKRLAELAGVGEGSMRRILDKYREWNFVTIKQTGISITKTGQQFLDQLPLRLTDTELPGSVVGEFSQGVLVLGMSAKIVNGMEQRDAGIKAGASGCTTVVIRDGRMMIPPDWDMDKETPDEAARIRRETNMTPADVLIVGSGPTKISAIEAALNAAFELI